MSTALDPFIWARQQAPYTADWLRPPLVVVPARSKSGFGTPRLGTTSHRIAALAAVFIDGRACYGARWQCGHAPSPDVVLLASEASHRGRVCYQCDPEEPCVYRCRSKAGDLLYVGTTIKRRARMERHSRLRWWWPEVASIEYEEFPSAADALLAERIAIRDENPLHNRAGCVR